MNKIRSLILVLMASGLLCSCSVFYGPDKQFTNELAGSVEIANDILAPSKEAESCDATPKAQREDCKEKADALSQSIAKANKSNDHQ